jgi:hypothetical protein
MVNAQLAPTSDGSVIDRNGKVVHYSVERFRKDIVEGDRCFMCGASRDEKPFNDEHIVPDWVLRKFDLHRQHVTLPNGVSVPYARYLVPCCVECNGRLGKEVEEPISELLKGSYAKVVEFVHAKGPWPLFAWMNLIYLKTHLKDQRLRFSLDQRVSAEKIGDYYDWGSLHHMHCVARAFHTGAKLDHRIMGSVLVLPAKLIPGFGRFDYADLYEFKTTFIQLGEVAIFCVLNDACATLSLIKDRFFKMIGGKLSPIQMREVLARLAHANQAITARPEFHTQFDNAVPHLSVTHPDQFTADPGDPLELGRLMDRLCVPFLSSYAGPNKDQVIEGIRKGVWTFLVTPEGKFDAVSMEAPDVK